MNTFNLAKIQEVIQKKGIDGWLMFDFRGSNELALQILNIPSRAHLTRRFYYYIPAKGNPVKIVNAIEAHNLAHLPGEECKYSSHESLKKYLRRILTPGYTIAMEYSPLNAIPYLSKVDAGTVEFIKTFGVDIISSGDLITLFTAIWTQEQYQENIPVANALTDIVELSFAFIKEKLQTGVTNEYEVQQFIMSEFKKRNLFTDHEPIVGVNANSANPHYSPSADTWKEIAKGDFVLIDLWAKTMNENSVWSDITWVGFCGETVPEKYTKIFNIVRDARDAAFDLVATRFAQRKQIMAYEVDDAARAVITKAGFGDYFIHRTGHSITTELHGSGAHCDNFETKDNRLIYPSTSFSIEPGIYLTGDFGVRSEIDVFIHPDGKVEQTGGKRQNEVRAIMV